MKWLVTFLVVLLLAGSVRAETWGDQRDGNNSYIVTADLVGNSVAAYQYTASSGDVVTWLHARAGNVSSDTASYVIAIYTVDTATDIAAHFVDSVRINMPSRPYAYYWDSVACSIELDPDTTYTLCIGMGTNGVKGQSTDVDDFTHNSIDQSNESFGSDWVNSTRGDDHMCIWVTYTPGGAGPTSRVIIIQ